MATIDLTENKILRIKEEGSSPSLDRIFSMLRKIDNMPWNQKNKVDVDSLNERKDNWFEWLKSKKYNKYGEELDECVRCGASISSRPWRGYAELCISCDCDLNYGTPWIAYHGISEEDRTLRHNRILNEWLMNGI